MLGAPLHLGSGAGDQLFRLITSRTIAEEKGYAWGMVNPENFKCASFMNLHIPRFVGENPHLWNEKEIKENGADVRSFDPEGQFLEDNTIIDGSFESFQYWGHNLTNINKWLEVEPLTVPDDTCVVGFRGGEYATVPELFLGTDYYFPALLQMAPKKFQVHTDDPALAKKFFSTYEMPVEVVDNEQISHSLHANMDYNWRSARFAKYAIIPNSAFFIIPRLLKHHEDPEAVTLSPRFWAGRNVKQWRRPACYYSEFRYL